MVRIGDIVIVFGVPSNGTLQQPAVVTRVWGPHCVNVTVIPDAGDIVRYTSVMRGVNAALAPGGVCFEERTQLPDL